MALLFILLATQLISMIDAIETCTPDNPECFACQSHRCEVCGNRCCCDCHRWEDGSMCMDRISYIEDGPIGKSVHGPLFGAHQVADDAIDFNGDSNMYTIQASNSVIFLVFMVILLVICNIALLIQNCKRRNKSRLVESV